MRKFSYTDNAVSPVIGVILMVAITVILAAVIVAGLYGNGGKALYSESSPASSGYVQCSDYFKITDKYVTPSGYHVEWEKYGRTGIESVGADRYPQFVIGGYANSVGFGLYPVNLTVVPESSSGMRDSCRLLP